MPGRTRLLALGSAMLLTVLVLVSPAGAHGTQDQNLAGDPGCLAATMKATAPASSSLRQEFIPSSGTGLQSVDLCLSLPSTANVTLNIRAGTAAAPGAILGTASATGVLGGTARVAHIELPIFVPMTNGTTYVIEITGFPIFSWRGTCGAIAGACTSVDPDLYPAGVSNSGPNVGDFWFRTYTSTDFDSDLIADPADNCPSTPNQDQANHDANFIDQTPPKSVDDLTLVNSDTLGDACDLDDDNDGLADTAETASPPCASTTATTDPLVADSDGDLILDGAECVLGSDPNDPSSKPANPGAANDPDGDRLSTAFETTLGSNPNNFDSDGDGLRDGVEYKNYNSNPLASDSDGDGTRDDCEATSLNLDTTVNSGDQGLLASEILRTPPPAKLANYDINKDGVINSGDQGFQANRALPGLC